MTARNPGRGRTGGRPPRAGNAHGPAPAGKKGTASGEYKRKAVNLSQKQLKAAGAAKAAKARTVSISSTKRITSGPNKGKTVGPGGKPLTGTVMINGKRAVYKDGKRVMVAPKTKAPASSGGSGGGGGGGGGAGGAGGGGSNPPKVGTIRKGAAGRQSNRWDGKKWVPVSGSARYTAAQAGRTGTHAGTTPAGKPAGTTTAAWNALSPAQKRQFMANAAKYGKAAGLNPARLAAAAASGGQNTVVAKAVGSGGGTPPRGQTGQVYVNGKWVSGSSSAAKANGPKVGDIKQTMSGRAKWDGTKWVKF